MHANNKLKYAHVIKCIRLQLPVFAEASEKETMLLVINETHPLSPVSEIRLL